MKTLVHVLVLTSLLVLFSCNGGGGSSSATGTTSGNNTTSYNIGDSVGGGLYAGNTNGNNLIITPSGCTDSATPTCSGNDSVSKWWSNDTTSITGITDTVDGSNNTNIITNAANGTVTAPAAQYCKDLVYGGYSDWYLPSSDEMQEIMDNSSANNNVLNFRDEQQNNGGTTAYRYYTSTERNTDSTRAVAFVYDSTMPDGAGFVNHVVKTVLIKYSGVVTFGTTQNYLIRCIRHQ